MLCGLVHAHVRPTPQPVQFHAVHVKVQAFGTDPKNSFIVFVVCCFKNTFCLVKIGWDALETTQIAALQFSIFQLSE